MSIETTKSHSNAGYQAPESLSEFLNQLDRSLARLGLLIAAYEEHSAAFLTTRQAERHLHFAVRTADRRFAFVREGHARAYRLLGDELNTLGLLIGEARTAVIEKVELGGAKPAWSDFPAELYVVTALAYLDEINDLLMPVSRCAEEVPPLPELKLAFAEAHLLAALLKNPTLNLDDEGEQGSQRSQRSKINR